MRPEQLPDAVLDENIDVNLIRRFFTNDAWLLVMDVVEQKQANPVFVCKDCYHDLGKALSIVCDHCLTWHHLKCVGLTNAPKSKLGTVDIVTVIPFVESICLFCSLAEVKAYTAAAACYS